jgi:GMP synthase (glutamine-hydrolysing)
VKKVLVCQHVAYEILGTLNPHLKTAGLRIKYVNFGRVPHARPSLDGYHALVVLGGPMNVDETDAHPHLDTEVELVRDALDREIPILGICLGAQILAKALGADVRKNGEKEIGWYPVTPTADGREDPLMSHFDGTEQIFQWHGDTFDIPEEAVHLAESPTCRNQAFRYRDNVYGLQFHLEVDEPMILRWLTVPGHVREIESLGGKIDPEVIRKDTPSRINRLMNLSERSFGEFVRLVGKKRRLHALPSR